MNTSTQHLSTVPEQSTISVLGPQGSFSHQAGELIRNGRDDIAVEDYSSMREVRRSVRRGEYALLPRINYSSGPEPDNQTALFSEPLRIRGQVMLKVQMCIGGRGEQNWSGISNVHSKDVALRQCREFLDMECPDAAWHEEISTVRGAQIVAEKDEPHRIAVASRAALEQNGLIVWKEGASNAEINGQDNVTDFMLVSREEEHEPVLDPNMRYHGMVLTPANRAGIMRDIDQILYDYGMDKESQPEQPYGPGLYRFLVLFKKIDTHADVRGMLEALEKLPAANGRYPLIKSLGSWNDRVLDPGLQSPDSLL